VVPIESDDEMGALASAFNAMTAELQDTMVSREYVDKILDSMLDVLIVVGPDGRMTRANTAAVGLLGYTVDEMIAICEYSGKYKKAMECFGQLPARPKRITPPPRGEKHLYITQKPDGTVESRYHWTRIP
jgi:nitrogen fixation/metabolism regulation signal transduction histidine kinase